MSIEKKSLISTLKTTKKANAVKDDIADAATVSPAQRLARSSPRSSKRLKPAIKQSGLKPATKQPAEACDQARRLEACDEAGRPEACRKMLVVAIKALSGKAPTQVGAFFALTRAF